VSAGPTREPVDPVRFIGNRSSGKMGYALAERALRRGADVVLVSGPSSLDPPDGVEYVSVETAEDMLRAVVKSFAEADLLIMAAAPADYRPVMQSKAKIKKTTGELTLKLVRTDDILSQVAGTRREGQGVVGFALETTAEIEEGRRKLVDKNLDIVVVNNPLAEGAGFDADTNVAVILTRSGRENELAKMPKADLADVILTEAINELGWDRRR
ncbi:bifunctional 4'-phosphopantothenoylcysteine decarboxylase/phosphopantothenoylcysteine synthetase, partial [bacterium]|nr:bifunctional 4'-phosphopantothenoylcysteine decarboxylase/phosphopantothenoylcysteine synthetase [bacterium]